jgi:hypothetical protein
MSFQPCQGICQGAAACRPRSLSADASAGEILLLAADPLGFRLFKYLALGMRNLWPDPFVDLQFDDGPIVPRRDCGQGAPANAAGVATVMLRSMFARRSSRPAAIPSAVPSVGAPARGWDGFRLHELDFPAPTRPCLVGRGRKCGSLQSATPLIKNGTPCVGAANPSAGLNLGQTASDHYRGGNFRLFLDRLRWQLQHGSSLPGDEISKQHDHAV